jgi:hypothetical protein
VLLRRLEGNEYTDPSQINREIETVVQEYKKRAKG